MSKKNRKKKNLRAPLNAPRREHQQRVTYMYKAGALMASNLVSGNGGSFSILSKAYMRSMDLVAKKAVLKLHPSIKRSVCKECSGLLIPGVTCKLRLENPSKSKLPSCQVLAVTCECGHVKRYPIGIKQDYTLFSERKDVLFDPGCGPEETQ